MDILEKLSDSKVQFSLLLLLLAFYLATKSPWVGALGVFLILFLVIVEILYGVKKHGIKNELKDSIIAIVVALGFWFSLTFLLHTSSPISAVVSCSMVDTINRGDLLVIQGWGDYKAKELIISKADLLSLYPSYDVEIIDNKTKQVIGKIKGSLFSYCTVYPSRFCAEFSHSPSRFLEKRGNFYFIYGKCLREGLGEEVCVKQIRYKDKLIQVERKGDIIVYKPEQNTIFYYQLRGGEVVHRAIIKLNVQEGYYYLTKGDNNNVFDIQYYSYSYGIGNTPVKEENVKGAVLFKIPFIGYYKLFLVGSLEEQPNCFHALKW